MPSSLHLSSAVSPTAEPLQDGFPVGDTEDVAFTRERMTAQIRSNALTLTLTLAQTLAPAQTLVLT